MAPGGAFVHSCGYAFLFLSVLGFQHSCGQVPPSIPEAFYSEYRLVQEGSVVKAVAYHDREAGKDRTVHTMGDGKGKVNFLIRLDRQAAYQYYEPYDYCSITERGNITIPNFDWVHYSKYKESMDFYGQNVDVWVYQDTSLYNEMGVLASSKDTPVFYFRSSGREESFTLAIFDVFTPGSPDGSKFDVPPSCLVPSVVQGQEAKEKANQPVIIAAGEDIQHIRNLLFKQAGNTLI